MYFKPWVYLLSSCLVLFFWGNVDDSQTVFKKDFNQRDFFSCFLAPNSSTDGTCPTPTEKFSYGPNLKREYKYQMAKKYDEMGKVYEGQGDLAQAIQCYQRALSYYSETRDTNDLQLAELCLQLGNALWTQDQDAHRDAEICYQQAMGIYYKNGIRYPDPRIKQCCHGLNIRTPDETGPLTKQHEETKQRSVASNSTKNPYDRLHQTKNFILIIALSTLLFIPISGLAFCCERRTKKEM